MIKSLQGAVDMSNTGTSKPQIKVEMKLLTGEDMKIKFNSRSMDDLIIARSRVPREETGGEAQELLAASVAECMGSTLFFLLRWAQIKLEDFQATVEVITDRDEQGRNCVMGINLNLDVDVKKDDETLKKIDRVKNIFNRGCLISRSLERGIKVNYSLDI